MIKDTQKIMKNQEKKKSKEFLLFTNMSDTRQFPTIVGKNKKFDKHTYQYRIKKFCDKNYFNAANS